MVGTVAAGRNFGSNIDLKCSTAATSTIAIRAKQSFAYFFSLCAGALLVDNPVRGKQIIFEAVVAYEFALMIIK